MKKAFVIGAMVFLIVMVRMGLVLKDATASIAEEKADIDQRVTSLQAEFREKLRFTKHPPKIFSTAFARLVNQMNTISTFSGINMTVYSQEHKDKNVIETLFINTAFRQVKGLPLSIRVQKVSQTADLGSAMDAITLLEQRTDLKVTDIVQDNGILTVKGVLYGL